MVEIEFQYALTANIEQDLTADLRVNSTVQFSYVDDVVLRSLGTAPDVQKGYGLLEGSIGFSWKQFSLQLFGKNLLDEDYRVNSLPNVLFQGWGNLWTVLVELTASSNVVGNRPLELQPRKVELICISN